jgi:hypothetical protein
MSANGRGCSRRDSSPDLIEDDVPCELLINQIEGRLIATSGNFFQRLLAVLTRGRSNGALGAHSFDDLPFALRKR